MNIWGKVIGFLLGYLTFRLPGALLGLYIGALFDRGLKIHLHTTRFYNSEGDTFESQAQAQAREQARARAREWYAGFEQAYSNARSNARQQMHTSPQASLEEAYEVLGVSSHASHDEIKKAYRKLMNQHHPDKLAARGLPSSMIKRAQEKTQQILAAYDMIRETRGFR